MLKLCRIWIKYFHSDSVNLTILKNVKNRFFTTFTEKCIILSISGILELKFGNILYSGHTSYKELVCHVALKKKKCRCDPTRSSHGCWSHNVAQYVAPYTHS